MPAHVFPEALETLGLWQQLIVQGHHHLGVQFDSDRQYSLTSSFPASCSIFSCVSF